MSLSPASASNFSLIGTLFAFLMGAFGHNNLLTRLGALVLMLGTGIWLFMITYLSTKHFRHHGINFFASGILRIPSLASALGSSLRSNRIRLAANMFAICGFATLYWRRLAETTFLLRLYSNFSASGSLKGSLTINGI